MDAAIKYLEEEKLKKRKTTGSGQSSRSAATTTNLNKAQSTQRLMNSSGSSFKGAASSEVRQGAVEDLDRMSMDGSMTKKKQAPRSLKPIDSKSQAPPLVPKKPSQSTRSGHQSDVIMSESLKHKQSATQGQVIDMGLGGGKVINHSKQQRKANLKDIEKDVKKFMQEFEEVKYAASGANLTSAFDDSESSHTSQTVDSQIMSQINSAFTTGNSKTKAELLLWQKQNHRKERRAQPKASDRAEEEIKTAPISSLTAKNLMALGAKGPSKKLAPDLQPIVEEGPDGKPISTQLYLDPEDPKKKKYDELKKKALLMAKKKDRKRQSGGDEISDVSSVKSGTSKQSESQMSLGTVVSAGTTSSVPGPFLTHARQPRSEVAPSIRAVTPPRTHTDGLSSFKAEFAAMTGKETQSQRSYSPIYKPRGLKEDDPDEVFDERVAEMALEMDMAMEYMGDLGEFLKKREDIETLQECEEVAADAIEDHLEMVEKMHAMILAENDLADQQMQEMLAIQASQGIVVEQPAFSAEGQKALEKERKRKKKIQQIYDITEDAEKEDAENSDDGIDEKSEGLSSQAIAIPQPSILTRALEEMNHAEAQEEVGDALIIMFDTIRQQTDALAEAMRLEESKAPSLQASSTKKSTYQASESLTAYNGDSSVMSSRMMSEAKTATALKVAGKAEAKEDRKLDKLAAEAQAFLLNNQKKGMMSETSSVTSVGKGTIVSKNIGATGTAAKSNRSGSMTKGAASKVPTGGMSFSKAGKALASKYL